MNYVYVNGIYDLFFWKEQIAQMLENADEAFVPPLSQRESATQSSFSDSIFVPNKAKLAKTQNYFDSIINQSFIIAVDKDNVVAFLSFQPNYVIEDKHCVYITTMLVKPSLRGQGVMKLLLTKLVEITKQHSITTRTWSTNMSCLSFLKKNHFVELIKLRKIDDRGQGIDTVYLRLYVDDFIV